MADEDTGISLADLAGLDVSEVQEVRFSSLPAGVFDFKVVEAGLDEGTNRDDEKRFMAVFKFEVVDVKAVIDRKTYPDTTVLMGKNHSEKLYIVPAKAEEGIGLIRAFVKDMGCPNEGALGPIIEGTVGHIFTGKIIEQKDREDKSRVYARLKLEQAK